MKFLLSLLFFISPFYSFAGEKDIYDFEWLDDDKEIYVLQNRRYRKVGRFNLSVLGTLNLSDKFVNNMGGGVKGAFFFKENWGIEAGFGIGKQSYNSTFDGVAKQFAVPFFNTIKQYMNLSLVWSPFYGKFNTFNVIYYLDWYLSAGLVSVTTQDDREAFGEERVDIQNKNFTLRDASSVGATWSTGLVWYLSKNFGLRMEVTGFHYNGDFFFRSGTTAEAQSNSTMFHNYNLSLGVNFLL